jgi:hypothetical protein
VRDRVAEGLLGVAAQAAELGGEVADFGAEWRGDAAVLLEAVDHFDQADAAHFGALDAGAALELLDAAKEVGRHGDIDLFGFFAHEQGMLEDILAGVAKDGHYRALWVGLANVEFARRSDSPPPEEQMERWCAAHGLDYEVYWGLDAHKQKAQWVRFARARGGKG